MGDTRQVRGLVSDRGRAPRHVGLRPVVAGVNGIFFQHHAENRAAVSLTEAGGRPNVTQDAPNRRSP